MSRTASRTVSWFSMTSVLLLTVSLREEMDMDIGDANKTHHSIRYEYGNVQAPPV